MAAEEARFFEMVDPVRLGPVTVETKTQESALGRQLAIAVSEGRAFELRQGDDRSILLLLTAADDLGHVYEISAHGSMRDIGTTERV